MNSRWVGLHHGSSYLEHMDFMTAVTRPPAGRAPAVTLQEGLLSVAVGVAAQRSIELGRAVTMQEVLESRHLTAAG